MAAATKQSRPDSPNEITIDYGHRGDVFGETLVVAKGGSVLGNITARVLKINGRVDGDVAADELYIGRHARISGSIRYGIMGMALGADVVGSVYRVPAIEFANAPETIQDVPVRPATRPSRPLAERRMKALPSLIA